MIIKFTGQALFSLVLLILVSLIFYISLDLGRLARLVPLRVVVVTLALVVFQLLLDLLPGLAERNNADGETGALEIGQGEGIGKIVPKSDLAKIQVRIPRSQKELGVFLWVLAIPAFIYLFGFLTTLPLYTFLSFKLRSRESWLVSTATASLVLCLIYGVFVILLGARLEEGVFWHWLG